MNERIKELAEQANANELSYAYYRGEKKPENAITLHSVDLEMFAELIVQECILHLHRRGIEGFGILEERNLNEHFGVRT